MTSGALLALFIVVPLIAAAVAAILPWELGRRVLGFAVPTAGIVGSGVLLAHVAGDQPTVLADNVGAFPGGISIPLAADTLTGIMLLTTAIVCLAATWFADIVGETRARFFPALSLMLIGGAWGALLTADLFNLFVFIEVMLMPSFGLIAMTGTWARLSSARMFIIVNLVTSLVLLTGVTLTYGVIGTTNLAALAGSAGPRGGLGFAEGVPGSQWQLVVTLGMVLLALAVKAGLAPVHTWLPRAYPATSPAVMALFSGLHTKVAVYAILRIYMTTFEGDTSWAWGILALSVLGMMVGSFAGLAEFSVRSVVAYQMVNGIPFMLVALAFLNNHPHLILSAALFYMLHHMVVAAALIMSSGAIEETYGTGTLKPLSGIMRRDLFVSVVFAAGALAIVGLPPFSGLWGKVGLVMGMAFDGSWKAWIAIGAIIVTSVGALFSMIYVWREVFWGRQMNKNECPPDLRVPTSYVMPSAAMMILSVAMFFGAGQVYELTGKATDSLTDTTGYVRAIMGPDDAPSVGRVLPPGPSGMDNVPAGMRSAADANAAKEREERRERTIPEQHSSTDPRVDSPQGKSSEAETRKTGE
ncbi:monovalent cation/H+ antiporter subunit D family protein [Corynebacterium auriscanis]|uniref:monovalent cation/H+ antiporter subunit D family protein n=1 Tax=Corynebacterium auriscanis TaxID=99807 RepID=UPI0024ADB217|nr:monovalent cation/H+ antiporter subunit D family protein [Corynebacterium auriscanis]